MTIRDKLRGTWDNLRPIETTNLEELKTIWEKFIETLDNSRQIKRNSSQFKTNQEELEKIQDKSGDLKKIWEKL